MFDARERGDVGGVLALMHPDIVATTIAGGRTYTGLEAVSDVFARLHTTGDRVEVTAQRLVPDGDRVGVFGRIRTITAGRLVDSPAAWTFTVCDGRLARIAPA